MRPVDTRRDISHVANLIETCFSQHMDEEGQEYLRHLRAAVRDSGMIHHVQGAGEMINYPLHGYVWVEDSKIVGNLTLMPYRWQGEWIYMIVNVAVHPDYRRRGIARQLTERALEHIHGRHVKRVCLHVRADNPQAINLYQSLGFDEITRRSTWISGGEVSATPPVKKLKVRPTHRPDWPLQSEWLKNAYPDEVAWNLGFHVARFNPGIVNSLVRFLAGDMLRQWSATLDGSLAGTASLEPTRQLSDTVWLAISPDFADQPVRALLQNILNTASQQRKYSVNLPEGYFTQAMTDSGLTLQNTLIWMEKSV
jgi:ribosomal protein S18 acetylase RimI-like enzyme